MNKVKAKIGFENIFVVDPVEKAGVLTLFWKKELEVKNILFSDFSIEVKIGEGKSKDTWCCVCIYASTDSNIRRNQ